MLLTLTTSNTGEIPNKLEIQAHNKAIGKLIKKFFKGGVSVNEVKGTYLHSHCIVYGPYVPHDNLAAEWEALTGNKVVDIREVKQKVGELTSHICKYIKKPYRYGDTEEGHSLAIQFLINFKGVRRVHSFGIFYAAKPANRKVEWACPYCESSNVRNLSSSPSWYMSGAVWTVEECEKSGIKSYGDILKAWASPIENGLAYA